MSLNKFNHDENTIIFCHYGFSDYLEFTLKCCAENNPTANLIFLGDYENEQIATKNGWSHYHFKNFRSSFHNKFDSVFKHIQGNKHNHMKNGNDWLKFVFERWFFIDGFLTHFNINRFWHFDSDTMILHELSNYNALLSGFDFTVQCNGTCLNGVINSFVVNDFCSYINDLFLDKNFIDNQILEFSTFNPNWAFTEMRAFDLFKKDTNLYWTKLINSCDNICFDDCITQSQGYQMCILKNGQIVKNIFSQNKKIFGFLDGDKIEFATMNLSYVSINFFKWVEDSRRGENSSIMNIRFSLIERLTFFFKRVIKGIL